VAQGVIIPKPGKDDYVGKVVEKVVANEISTVTDLGNQLHEGQYGCRRRRSAVDAAGVLMSVVQEVWKQKKVAAALMIDVAAAFPSIARECLLRKMREMELDKNLVGWTDSFMRERIVRMVVDGWEGKEMEVTTGLPKRSLVSLILFAVYIAGVYDEVESQVPGVRGLSFVDDVTWLAVGVTVGGLVEKLETCARMSEWWTRDNAVRFETSKTEAPPILPYPIRPRNKRQYQSIPISMGTSSARGSESNIVTTSLISLSPLISSSRAA